MTTIRTWLKKPMKPRTRASFLVNGVLDIVGAAARDYRVGQAERRITALEAKLAELEGGKRA